LCAGCRRERKRSDWTCPECGYTRVSDLLGVGGLLVVVALVLLLIGFSSPLFVALLLYVLALACLALPASEVVKALRTPKRYEEMAATRTHREQAQEEERLRREAQAEHERQEQARICREHEERAARERQERQRQCHAAGGHTWSRWTFEDERRGF